MTSKLCRCYLDNYLESVESLPYELSRNFSFWNELEGKFQSNIRDLEDCLNDMDNLTDEQKLQKILGLQQQLKACLEFGYEKTKLATASYYTVEARSRKLDKAQSQYNSTLRSNLLNSSSNKENKEKEKNRNKEHNKQKEIQKDKENLDHKKKKEKIKEKEKNKSHDDDKDKKKEKTKINNNKEREKQKHDKQNNKEKENKKEKEDKKIKRVGKKEIEKRPKRNARRMSTNEKKTACIIEQAKITQKEKETKETLKRSKKSKKVVVQDIEDDEDDDEDDDYEDEELFCYCRDISFGDMVGCDGKDCKYEWFHYGCVGLKTQPKGKWFCKDCKKK